MYSDIKYFSTLNYNYRTYILWIFYTPEIYTLLIEKEVFLRVRVNVVFSSNFSSLCECVYMDVLQNEYSLLTKYAFLLLSVSFEASSVPP
jgi:hypothetical protein